ncbi:hypothetical protein TNCV_4573571 [Trichonephila clavipes]|nr:hypothetical protein TNCV_4573571 [Trichonephila clavipes]
MHPIETIRHAYRISSQQPITIMPLSLTEKHELSLPSTSKTVGYRIEDCVAVQMPKDKRLFTASSTWGSYSGTRFELMTRQPRVHDHDHYATATT